LRDRKLGGVAVSISGFGSTQDIFEGSVVTTTREAFAACERSDRRLRLFLGETMMESARRFSIVLMLAVAAALFLTFLT